MLIESIHLLDPDLMVLCSEIRLWRGNGCNIDILALDREHNLVIFEIRRSVDYRKMDIQALRYVALTSKMTFDQAVKIHQRYLDKYNIEKDAQKSIKNFLNTNSFDPSKFNLKPKIFLVAEDFLKELLANAIWHIKSRIVDITCICLSVYKSKNNEVLISINKLVLDPNSTEYDVSFI
jgi:hypothetical protein